MRFASSTAVAYSDILQDEGGEILAEILLSPKTRRRRNGKRVDRGRRDSEEEVAKISRLVSQQKPRLCLIKASLPLVCILSNKLRVKLLRAQPIDCNLLYYLSDPLLTAKETPTFKNEFYTRGAIWT